MFELKDFGTLADIGQTIIIFIICYTIAKIGEFFILSNQRVRKDIELRRDLDVSKIEEVTFQIRDLALKYRRENTSSEKKVEFGNSITARIDYLDDLIYRLFEFDMIKRDAVYEIFAKYCHACSGFDFFGENSSNIPQLSNVIESYAYELVDLSMNLRRKLPFEKNK